MKILFLVTESWYFESHRLELAKELSALGHEIAVASNVTPNASPVNYDGVQQIDLPFSRSSLNPLRELLIQYKVAKLIAQAKPDLIHAVAIKPIFSLLLSVLLFSKPTFVAAYAGMGSVFIGRSTATRFLRRILEGSMRWLGKHKNCWALVQNEDDKALLTERGIFPAERIGLIPGSGVMLPSITVSGESQRHKDRIVIVLPARMIAHKGVHEFIEASRALSGRGDVRFRLVGGTDPDNPGSIAFDVLNEWNTLPNVEWLGPQKDMATIYKEADIVCLPSYREGLPRVLLEAAAYGIPLVASDVPGNREICVHEQTGLLVHPQDAGSLGDALIRLIEDQYLRRQLGVNARALVEKRFSMNTILRQTARFYEQITTSIN